MNDGLFFAGWMLDGSGAPARKDLLLRVQNGVIESLEHAGKEELGAGGVDYEDFSECTVLPGLVDCHVHLTLSGSDDEEIRREQIGYSFEQNEPLMRKRIRKYLTCGILALRDGGDAAAHTLRYKIWADSARRYPVYLKAAGKGWRAEGRYGKLIGAPPEDGLSLAESIDRQFGADHVKILNSGLNSLVEFGMETPPQFRPEELEAAVRTARRKGLETMVHANGKLPVELAVRAGCRSIEHGFFMGEANMKMMADRQIFWVPTAFAMKALESRLPPGQAEIALKNLEHQLAQISRARELGVPVAVGTDAGGFGIRHGEAYREELKLFVLAGFSPEEVIRCATWEGARLLGLEQELGCLRKGMSACFVVVPGSPGCIPESLCRIRAVYFRGLPVTIPPWSP
jgi:imidazolonepropionase-like amidohydrolase